MLESHKVWACVSLCLRDGLEVKAEAVRSEVEANIKKQLSGCRASLITNATAVFTELSGPGTLDESKVETFHAARVR